MLFVDRGVVFGHCTKQKEVTGESELDNIVDFEAIFVRVERVANLEYTPSLRSFTCTIACWRNTRSREPTP